MPTLIMESSPKFITCPDCGEQYDNARKRRIIDTCGHPRCYSCLFMDNPCPVCQELPKQQITSRPKSESQDSLTTRKIPTTGSNNEVDDIHKARSSTLPPSFRQDNYFRSLYRSNTQNGSSESLGSGSSSPRPRSMPPSYHVSIENLNEQFWKSVEFAEKKWSPSDRKTKKRQSREGKANSHRPEVVECPAPDTVSLPVPAETHPKSQLDNHLKRQEHKKIVPVSQLILSELDRPRSFSDVDRSQAEMGDGPAHNFSRPLSWSPTNFRLNNRTVCSRPSSGMSKSDRFSDSSTSINLSDTWSESSDSDSVYSPSDDKAFARGISNSSGSSNSCHSPPRKYKGNPLANVTYWVVESRSSQGVPNRMQQNNENNYQAQPKISQEWKTRQTHCVKASLVSVNDNNNTM